MGVPCGKTVKTPPKSEDLGKQVLVLEAIVSAGEIRITQLEATNLRLVIENNELKTSPNRIKEEAHRLEAENERLTEETKKLTEKIDRITEESRQSQEEASKFKEDNSKLREDSYKCKEDNNRLKAENHQLKEENDELKKSLADPKAEIESLKKDVRSFKQWTKKLDWSTANIPDALTKHYEIKQVNAPQDTVMFGRPVFDVSVQLVDGRWHGPFQFTLQEERETYAGYFVNGFNHGFRRTTNRGSCPGETVDICWMGKNLHRDLKECSDGALMYQCADEEYKGVAVTLLSQENQLEFALNIKNGYKIMMHTYKEEILVIKVEDNTSISRKWYQLKK